MKTGTPVTAPLFNVNDESVLVVKWMVSEGDRVGQGQVLLAIETSKAMVEIEAPEAGYMRMPVSSGKEVAVGSVLCYLTGGANDPIVDDDAPSTVSRHLPHPTPTGNSAPANRPRANGISATGEESTSLRITPVARKIMEEHGIDAGRFAGGGIVRRQDVSAVLDAITTGQDRGSHTSRRTSAEPVPGPTRFSAGAKELMERNGLSESLFESMGLVRASDVEALLVDRSAGLQPADIGAHESRPEVTVPAADANIGALASEGVPFRTEELARRKRMEAKYLSAGATHTLPSTVIVACPTRGLRAAAIAEPKILGSASAVIVYEAARLLREYPLFNAFYADGRAQVYDEVHIGFAVDSGRRLMVPVIRNADQKSIAQIAQEMEELIEKYLDNALSVESLSGGTFTITDLSGESVFSFSPLINRGQSAILGIGAEFFPPGSSEGMFNLILAFDHQLSEGREAAKFLSSLKTRLEGYEKALTPRPDPVAVAAPEPLYCSRCYRDVAELDDLSIRLVPTIRSDGSTQLLCTSCLNGF